MESLFGWHFFRRLSGKYPAFFDPAHCPSAHKCGEHSDKEAGNDVAEVMHAEIQSAESHS